MNNTCTYTLQHTTQTNAYVFLKKYIKIIVKEGI